MVTFVMSAETTELATCSNNVNDVQRVTFKKHSNKKYTETHECKLIKEFLNLCK